MRRMPPTPSRVHSVTLAIWLSAVVAIALVWSFPRFFGSILLMVLGIAGYGLLYAFIEARMAAGDFAESLDDELEEPTPPVRPPRPRRKKIAPLPSEPPPPPSEPAVPIKPA